MSRKENEAYAKRIVQFYKINGGLSNCDAKKITCRHFMVEGTHRQVILRIINRFNERGSIEYLKMSGRKPFRSTESVRKIIQKDPEISVKEGAKKAGMPSSTYQFIKKYKLGINGYVKESVPKYSDDQKARAKNACCKLYRKIIPSGGGKIIIMDDETYVHLDPKQVPGRKYYHSKTKIGVADNVRFKHKQKFPKKFIVWQAIDQFGNVSEPYISEGTINGDTYLNECLIKRLLPFIHKHHNLNNILFWPDLATAHYHRSVQSWLHSQNINFVKKGENAPNVPQARPIERYWAECKKEYSKRKVGPKTLIGFRRIWKNLSVKVAQKVAKTIMNSLRLKLRAIGY
jgi:transposase